MFGCTRVKPSLVVEKMHGTSSSGSGSRLNISTFLSMIVIGAAISLLGFNYFHTLSCPDKNPDATEASIMALSHRLQESESLIQHNGAVLTRLMKDMEEDLTVLDQATRERIRTESVRAAVSIALQQQQQRSPPKSITFESDHGIEYEKSEGWMADDKWEEESSKGEGDIDDYLSADEIEKERKGENQFKDPDQFGGRVRDDDKQQHRNGGVFKGMGMESKGDTGDDAYDDPAESATDKDTGEIFRDNLSDADARHICVDWKHEHNVVPGVSWGSLPFQLQQKWLQYACDYLLV